MIPIGPYRRGAGLPARGVGLRVDVLFAHAGARAAWGNAGRRPAPRRYGMAY